MMAQIIVRNIEEDVKERLQKRATRNGRSMEAEVRDILRAAVHRDQKSKRPMGTAIADLFEGIGLEQGEAIHEWRGFTLPDPFER